MVFRVMAAGDLEGKTHNFEYAFPTLPTLHELKTQVEGVFSREVGRAVVTDRLQVYDEVTSQWAELSSGRQLRDGCQVFVFVSGEGKEGPVSPDAFTGGGGVVRSPKNISPIRSHARSTSPASPSIPAAAVPVTHHHPTSPTAPSDTSRYTFDFADVTKTRKLTQRDLQEVCRKIRLPFDAALMESMFLRADYNDDGSISYAEWCRFCSAYPKLAESFGVRIKQYRKEEAHRTELLRQQDILAACRKTADEKLAQFHASIATMETQKINLLKLAEECDQVHLHEGEVQQTQQVIEGDLQAAVEELGDAKRDRQHAVEREEEQANTLKGRQREVERCGARLGEQEQAIATTRETIRELEYELDQAARTLAQQDQQRSEMVLDLKIKQDDEALHRTGLAEARRDMQSSSDTVVKVETNLARIRDALRQTQASERDLAHTLHLITQKRDAEERELEKLDSRVVTAQTAHATSEQQVEEQMQAVTHVHEVIDAMSNSLEATSADEVNIITEEWHLHDQRLSLEDREVQLGVRHNQVQSLREKRGAPPESSTARVLERLAAPLPHGSPHSHHMSVSVRRQSESAANGALSQSHILNASRLSSIPRGGGGGVGGVDTFAEEDFSFSASSLRHPLPRPSPSASAHIVPSATPMPQSYQGSPSRYSNANPSPGGIARGLAEAIHRARSITRF